MAGDRVRCTHCQGIYRLGDVEKTIARHADCTVFVSPCCGREVDDRRWKLFPDIEEVWEPAPEDLPSGSTYLVTRPDGTTELRAVS